ncbi:MAG TPA: sensor histidine kinase [Candidatus Dormibacteraeota bacterium]|jgi:signal transduction histidine kinase
MSGALPLTVRAALSRALRPPVRDRRFWIVQGLVILIAMFHEAADSTSFLHPLGIPAFATVALFLVPIVYAALNFGITGSLATAAWVTLLTAPDFFFTDAGEHHTSDLIQILIVDSVAFFVGYRVDQERVARQRAEAAREAHRLAETRIRHYAERLLRAEEDERRLLSQELHDQPLQDLIHLLRLLDRGSVEEARKVATDVVSQLRQISRGLRPPILDDLGVGAALHKLVADFQPRTDIAASFRIEGGVRRLTPEVELGLFRIAQEALNNVARHSEAAKVAVRMCFTDTDVQLSVSDDGVGFERGRAGDAALGMIGMTERASLVGGRLDVRTSPGRGTSVQTVVPLPHLAT